MLLAAYIFLTLHLANGHEVHIALNEIVSLRESEDKGNFTEKARCMVATEDGKFINVIETCAMVRDLIRDEIDKLPNDNRG